jgi:uncharacterized protein (TIGR03437 family)
MRPIYKTFLLLSAGLLMTLAPMGANAQNFDTSGTAGVTGQYLFRYVALFPDQNGNIQEQCSLTGTMSFDGKGSYTLSNTQLYDSAGSSTGSCASLGGGTYGVQSNGIAQLDNPVFPATLFGTFSQPVISASSTEDEYMDMFVAVQAPTTSFSNSNLKGTYTVGSLEFPNVQTSQNGLTHQGFFPLNADGNGNIAAFTVTGSAANLAPTTVTQNITGATYSISGTAGGTMNIPNQTNSQLISGMKTLYVSADGNYIVGGSTTSADMIFGFRSATSPSNSLVNSTYFTSGIDASIASSGNFLDAFYGSINANGAGTLIWHERFDDQTDVVTYDNTFDTAVTIGANGSYYDGTYTTLVGFNGQAIMLLGSGSQFSLNIGVQAPTQTPKSAVWINPLGITNASNYTPITNAYSPGELVNIYGNFGVSQQVDQSIPIPTTLGGVQVMVNGIAAPVYLVSPSQISALIPYEIATVGTDSSGNVSATTVPFITFQVIVNGASSNSVTLYADVSSPGIYSLAQTGIGPGAILHSNYTAVTSSSPAVPGETVSLFMNGLGPVLPAVADGAAGPASPLSNTVGQVFLYLDDGVDTPPQATITFAGLAPGLPGLYQVNFTVPRRGLGNGDVYLALETAEATTEMSTIALSGFSHAAAPITNVRRAAAVKRAKQAAAVAASSKSKTPAKSARRALPDRVVE